MPNGILEVKQIKQLSADGGGTVVDVENKTIDGVAIGGATPAAGSFTSVDATSASLDGAVTINDSGADVDFRVESDTNENALFVEGSTGEVSLGKSSPSAHLHVYGVGTASNNWSNTDSVGAAILIQDAGAASFNGGQLLFGANQGVFAGIKGVLANGAGPAGYLVFQTRSTSGDVLERMRIDTSGNVNISNLSASSDVQTDASKNLITTSDARLKNEIGLIDESGIEVIKQIIPKYFSWKNDENNNQQLGFFAQDIYPVLPEAAPRALKYTEVGRDENNEPIIEQVFDEDGNPDYEWGFTDRPIIAMCVKAIQEQQTIIESQQAQIDALSARLDALENPPA